MARLTMDRNLARAIAHDEATRQMRKAGRTAWNEDDYNLACETYCRLLEQCDNAA